MDSVSFSFAANVVGVVSGSISLLGLFITFYRSHLPSAMFLDLEKALDDTESAYSRVVEAGVLSEQQLRHFHGRLKILQEEYYEHGRRVYPATTLLRQYGEFFRGLSFAIGRTYNGVGKLRALIIGISEVEQSPAVRRTPLVPERIAPRSIYLDGLSPIHHHYSRNRAVPTLTAARDFANMQPSLRMWPDEQYMPPDSFDGAEADAQELILAQESWPSTTIRYNQPRVYSGGDSAVETSRISLPKRKQDGTHMGTSFLLI